MFVLGQNFLSLINGQWLCLIQPLMHSTHQIELDHITHCGSHLIEAIQQTLFVL